MNIQKKSFFLSLMSVFCLSIKAESSSLPFKAYVDATICLISCVATIPTIHHIKRELNYKKPGEAFKFGLLSVLCGYTAYRSGISAYSSYKKARTSMKSLPNSSDKTSTKEKSKTEEQNSSLKSNIQGAALLGDTSL